MINGLTYIYDFISENEESNLISIIDSYPWEDSLKSRRVQQYGFKYDYLKKTADSSSYIGPIPFWIQHYCQKLFDKKYFHKIPDQVIINEYLPGQGISKHVDCIPCFDKTIASLSLNSFCIMDLEHIKTHKSGSLMLEPRSLLVFTDEARYDWMHSIPFRKEDEFSNKTFIRGRRISLTFRNVIL